MDIGSRECYVGMLYSCYDLIRPDLVMEISWRNGLNDFSMPYFINMLSEQVATVQMLKKDNEERKSKETTQKKEEDNTPILGASRLMLTQGPANPPPAPTPMTQSMAAPMAPMSTGMGMGMPMAFGQPNGLTPQTTGFRPF